MPLCFEPFYLLTHFGYIALALLLAGGIFGLPIPDEMILIFCGYLIYIGHIDLLPTIASAAIGSLTGMSISYGLGNFIGLPAVHRFGKYTGMTEQRLYRAEIWFKRFGKYAVMIGYFIPGVRQLTAFLSAVNQMGFRDFFFCAIPGGLVWVSVFIGTGWYLGRDWHKAHYFFRQYHHMAIILAGIALLVVLVYLFRAKDRN